jgi:hypothetical protein
MAGAHKYIKSSSHSVALAQRAECVSRMEVGAHQDHGPEPQERGCASGKVGSNNAIYFLWYLAECCPALRRSQIFCFGLLSTVKVPVCFSGACTIPTSFSCSLVPHTDNCTSCSLGIYRSWPTAVTLASSSSIAMIHRWRPQLSLLCCSS